MEYRLSAGADNWFLQKGTVDPLSRGRFRPGDAVVVCGRCRAVHLRDSWILSGRKCPVCKSRSRRPDFDRNFIDISYSHRGRESMKGFRITNPEKNAESRPEKLPGRVLRKISGGLQAKWYKMRITGILRLFRILLILCIAAAVIVIIQNRELLPGRIPEMFLIKIPDLFGKVWEVLREKIPELFSRLQSLDISGKWKQAQEWIEMIKSIIP